MKFLLGAGVRDHDTVMCAYVRLARLAHEKQQWPSRDKFLTLAAASACRAGWPAVAERCRELVLAHNPRHQIGRFATVADALRSEDFQALLHRLEKFCPYERAEFLLRELSQPALPPEGTSAGDWSLQLLSDEASDATSAQHG